MKKGDWPTLIQGGPGVVAPPDVAPRPASILARVKAGVRYMVTGAMPSTWFGPLQPIPPVAPDVKGRTWDYVPGYNLAITPRQYEPVGFEELRGLADAYDLLRLVIETRKDQVARLQWRFRVKESITKRDREAARRAEPRVNALTEKFEYPDNEHDFDEWLRMILEDMLVIDAVTIYPRKNLSGTAVYGYELLDGATIIPRINNDGRTPEPPDCAYQQSLHGVPAVDFSRDELVYRPRNRRTNHVYGCGPVQQVMMSVNIALRRQMFQLAYFSEGNIPEALATVPESWTADQIREYQAWWDELLTGNLADRRKVRFIPGGTDFHMNRPDGLKDEFDDWLARIVCFAFSISPQQLTKQMNRATAQSSYKQAQEEGLEPILIWIRRLINYLLWKYEDQTDIEFAWEEETSISQVDEAAIADRKIRAGEWTIDESRERQGLDPLPDGLGARPLVYTGTTVQLLSDVVNPTVGGDNNGKPQPPQGAEPEKESKEVAQEGEGGSDGITKLEKGSLEKAKKKVPPIDRERKVILQARKDMISLLMPRFTKVKKQLVKLYSARPVEKWAVAPELEEKVMEILNQLDTEDWAVMTDEFGEILDHVVTDGIHEALLQIGMDVEPGGEIETKAFEKAVEYARERAAALVGKKVVDGEVVDNPNPEYAITDATREMLRSDVARAIEEGMSTKQFADLLEENYAFSEERAETIAITEIGNCDVGANMIAYRESGVVTGKYWLLGSEHDGDDECDSNAEAGVIGLDELFPSGDDAPLAHPRCACDLGVTVEGEE